MQFRFFRKFKKKDSFQAEKKERKKSKDKFNSISTSNIWAKIDDDDVLVRYFET